MRFNESGWLDLAIIRPGSIAKTSGTRPRTTGDVLHSSEGGYSGTMAVLFGSREVSWGFTIDRDGRIYQHYPFLAWTWHARGGNSWTFGVEFIRWGNQSLTSKQEAQAAALIDAAQDFMLQYHHPGWEHWVDISRTAPYKDQWEHNEIPGSNTACPSGFVDWVFIFSLLRNGKEETLSSPEYDTLLQGQQSTNKILTAVGALLVEQTSLNQFQSEQIRFLSKIAVGINKKIDNHLVDTTGAVVENNLPTSLNNLIRIEELEDIEKENRARMEAAKEALVDALALI